jgi:hypothetical protein
MLDSAAWLLLLQAYKYIQRPALPVELADGGSPAQAVGTRVVSGQPIGLGGRARPSLFPPFPQVCQTLSLPTFPRLPFLHLCRTCCHVWTNMNCY